MSRTMHIYLSGGMEYAANHGADWRADLERLLTAREGWSVFNPVRESERFLAEHHPGVVLRELKHADPERFRTIVAEIVRRDSAEVVERADAVICLWDESAARGAGTQGELTLAARHGTPVVLITTMPFEEIPGWIIGCSTRICTSLEEAVPHLQTPPPSARVLIGRTPIPAPLLVLAKAALAVCWAFPLAVYLGAVQMPPPAGLFLISGIAAMFAGAAAAVTAILHLGESLAVGLPDVPPGLRTRGLYRFSRNPIYLGALVMCGGSVLLAPHPVNILACLTATSLHGWIVRREEHYLSAAYGDAWHRYAARVNRWIGRRP